MDGSDGKLDVSRQLGQRMAGPPMTLMEVALEEVFMEQGIAGPSTTTEYKAGAGLLPLKDNESTVISILDSQLSDVAAHPGHPGYQFWRYKRALHSAPTLLPNPITARGIPQRADYVAFNEEEHAGEPTIYLTMGGNAPIFYNVLHAKPRPEMVAGTGGDRCLVPKTHSHYRPLTRPTCPYAGSNNVVLYRQVKCSGIDNGEEVDKLIE